VYRYNIALGGSMIRPIALAAVGHDGRTHYSHTATIRHPQRYFWAKGYKPPWHAHVTVGHPRPPGPEYGEIRGHLDPFEIPLRSWVLRIIVSAAVARTDALAGV
jgi:hypothetical protein